ncbi:hypothetical protein ACIQ57_10070 [Lysinibacillus xylanilyticus]|uniref:hypothetical protein n=1 Tax=Lysinibacillus xylanilyticus TaxID=582475 RepID=UPI00380FF75C
MICYTGWNVDFHYDDKDEEESHIIRFGSSPFPIFGKGIEIVKEYLLEKHGIRDFRYFDPDRDEDCDVNF